MLSHFLYLLKIPNFLLKIPIQFVYGQSNLFDKYGVLLELAL